MGQLFRNGPLLSNLLEIALPFPVGDGCVVGVLFDREEMGVVVNHVAAQRFTDKRA